MKDVSDYMTRSPSLISPAAQCGYPPSTPLLLALSGGADSRLLLHLIAEQCKQSGAALHLAHVHHGIRGKEADDDAEFCLALSKEYHLPLHTLRADVPAIARKSGESLETAARRVRYNYFAELMREYSLPILLTAHHADDNLETVLFHLARGTGLTGLCGIAPVRPFPEAATEKADALSPVVVRPLLEWTRQDVLDACRAYGLSYVTDSTNADTSYARNRLRAQAVPALEAVVEHPQRQLLRTCRALREDESLLTELAQAFLTKHLWQGRLPRAALADAPLPIAKRALRIWLKDQTGSLPEACQLDALLRLCERNGTSHRQSVGNGYVVIADRQHLRVEQQEPPRDPVRPFEIVLEEGEHEYADLGFRTSLCCFQKEPQQTPSINVYNPFIRHTLTFDTIIWRSASEGRTRLFFRNRRAGDTLLLNGMHRSLRKLQNERAIPPELRDRIPLLCDDEGIVWAPMIGVRDGMPLQQHQANESPTGAMRLTVELITL